MQTRDQKHFLQRAAFFAAAALACLLALCGRAAAAPAAGTQALAHFTIADFDGDSRPDLASVQVGQSGSRDTRYWIAFELSGGSAQTVGITAPTGGLQITSRDVNGDSFPDVVVTTAWTNRPIVILLNDGSGNFTPVSPSKFQGAFAAPESNCASRADEIRDATALLYSRGVPGNSQEKSRSLPPRRISGLLAPYSCGDWVLACVSPFVGRAPPL
jgi:FG-GAP-like repeat